VCRSAVSPGAAGWWEASVREALRCVATAAPPSTRFTYGLAALASHLDRIWILRRSGGPCARRSISGDRFGPCRPVDLRRFEPEAAAVPYILLGLEQEPFIVLRPMSCCGLGIQAQRKEAWQVLITCPQ